MKNLSGKDMASKNIKKKQKFQTFQDTIFNLQYGLYIDSVFDASGCYFIDSMLVDTGNILVDASVLVPCNDSSGVITLTTNGISLTSIVWTNETDVVFDPTACGGVGCNVPVILQNDSNFTTSILTGVTPQEYYYDIQLTGCDPVKDTILVGATVTMVASLDLVNSVLDLDCFNDEADSIFIDVSGEKQTLYYKNSNILNHFKLIFITLKISLNSIVKYFNLIKHIYIKILGVFYEFCRNK